VTRLHKLADILEDMNWHTNTELVEKVGHRFGAQVHQLRKGEFDATCWVIESMPVEGEKGIWQFRLTGFATSYTPKSPKCPHCGHTLTIHDVRTQS
jgi:hypothetical protein